MNIQTINIKNFKVFESQSFSFNQQMNVIIGNNATGKTSLLEALSFSLGTFFLGLKGVDKRPLKNKEKRRKILSTDNVEIQLPFQIDLEHTLNGATYKWQRSTDKAKGGSTTYKQAKKLINAAESIDLGVRNDERINLPLLSYYGTDRVNSKHQRSYHQEGSRFDGYYCALNPEVLKLQFIKWFKHYEDSVLKFDKDKGLYCAFTDAMIGMIKDWDKIHYNWKVEDILGQNADKSWTSLSMLSAGYKNIARLTADIAYRAIILNPHLKEKAVVETEGVVLIDEIDMHLALHRLGELKKDASSNLTCCIIRFLITI